MKPSASSRAFALILIFFSGLCGLGYQMVWTRLFAAGLGHEVPAIVSVLAAFLVGMAIGAWTLDRRWAGGEARRSFARLELAIGIWGLATAALIPWVNPLALDLLGPRPALWWHWTVVFIVPCLTLLPSTLAMGATLPTMERFYRPLTADGRGVGAVYFANTFGAVAGTLASTFLVMPTLGLAGALLLLAALNVGVGLVLSLLRVRDRRAPSGRTSEPITRRSDERRTEVNAAISSGRLKATAAAMGFLGIGFELIGVRGLAQVLENTAYTYACALAVFLAGTALGGAAYQQLLRRRSARTTLNNLLAGLALSILGAAWILRNAASVHRTTQDFVGDGFGATVIGEMLVATILFAPPTLLMGCVFSLVAQEAAAVTGRVARIVGWNTFGCGVAAVVVTLWALPGLGLRHALLAVALGYLLFLIPPWRREWRLLVVPLGVLVLFPSTIDLTYIPAGAELTAKREGVLATATVVRNAEGHRTLRVNNRLQMGGTSSSVAQEREAHLPLLLHPEPRTALFLGPGTGITLGAAAAHPGLQVTGVELLLEVIELMPEFAPENHGPFPKPGVELWNADARRFVRTDTNRYDVIVADLFHPSQDGAGFLYTKDHFTAVRRRLSEHGLFCQWLPLHQLDTPTLQMITRTFTEVFFEARAVLLHFNADIPVLGLLGARERIVIQPIRLEQRLADPGLRATLRRAGLDKSINILGCLAAGSRFLIEFGRDADVATDLNPTVLFLAPRATARRTTPLNLTLADWLQRSAPARSEIVQEFRASSDPALAQTMDEYLAARDGYLRGLMREADRDLGGAIELYLESSRQSLYFTPAYARLVTIIQVLASAEPERARALWRRLEGARPDQPLGQRLLGPLFDRVSPGLAPAPKE